LDATKKSKLKLIGSVLIKLRVQKEIKVLGNGGEALYGLILDILSVNNRNLSKEIQDSKKEKPLTISPFLKGTKSSQGYSLLFPNTIASFRITYLKEEILEPIIREFLSIREKSLKFSKGEIFVERVDWQQGKKAGFTSFEEIYSRAQDERKVIMEFCSPTSLQSKDKKNLFPLPEHVFGSLQKKWNAFSGIKIPFKIQEEFEKINLTQFRLKTESVNLSKHKIMGFMGKVAYELPENMNKDRKSAINALADFAFYSGVGGKTYMGLGQARRLNNPAKNNP